MIRTSFPLRHAVRNGTALVLVAAVLAGCGAVDYTPPTAELPASFSADAPARDATRNQQWWAAFNDAQLNQMIQLGLARNLDVAQSIEAVNEARANARLAGAADTPVISTSASATRGDSDGTGVVTTQTSGTAEVSWMIDLFGRNANRRAQAGAELDSAYLSVDVARLTMMSAIANAYIDARYYQEAMALTRQSIESRQKSLELTQAQVEYGSAPRLDLVQAQQLVAQAQAQLPALEVGFDQSVNSLATLTNQRTAVLKGMMVRGAPQPRPRYSASVGVPAEAIRNRPDVIAAERDYAAAVYGIGVAKAAFYPSLSLSGSITPIDVSGSGSVKTWSFGPTLSLPIFNQTNNANLSITESRARQQNLNWNATVLDAIEEVENALAAYNRDGRNIAAQRRLVETAQETVDLARTSFEIGDTQFFTVLDAERTLLDARTSLAQAVRQQASNFVALSVATAGSGLGPRAPATSEASVQTAAAN
ncbi:efflux transporter outer membrane subunit [Falsirhodobacter algicola]|uniref:Efflux transporter outer membrane subunit n=1 Tax=Falsirhodobacter algicola TaxID=2692330 RepID=A0A8J8MVL9_9RHOB|nr:efflux transporter outer membrane subunit [Falsirhodobacter algicola]QUS37083.1 efflux transporter outer membrane subunit [Falsirhodobacter algicola]